MLKIARNDLYRLRKSKLFYFFILFTGFISLLLMILNRQDIRLGISVFGNLTTFITANDIIKIGIEYQKGLGIVAAVFVSVFVGQEYLWNTWQHKWLISKSRIGMYLSKTMISSLTAIAIFLFYEVIALLFSGQMKELFTVEYVASLICGSFLYASLGAVICLISMLIKNSTASIIVSLCYVLFSETLATAILNISSLFNSTGKMGKWFVQHTVYGMSSAIYSTANEVNILLPVISNSLAIIGLTAFIGTFVFRRYEL